MIGIKFFSILIKHFKENLMKKVINTTLPVLCLSTLVVACSGGGNNQSSTPPKEQAKVIATSPVDKKEEEKSQSTPSRKPQEQSPVMPENKSQEQPQVVPENKPQEQPQVVPENKPQEQPQVVPENKPQEQPQVVPENKPQEQPQVVPENKPQEQPQVVPENKPQEQPQVVPENKPQEQPQVMPENKPQEQPQVVPDNKSQEQPQLVPESKPQEQPQVMPDESETPTQPLKTTWSYGGTDHNIVFDTQKGTVTVYDIKGKEDSFANEPDLQKVEKTLALVDSAKPNVERSEGKNYEFYRVNDEIYYGYYSNSVTNRSADYASTLFYAIKDKDSIVNDVDKLAKLSARYQKENGFLYNIKSLGGKASNIKKFGDVDITFVDGKLTQGSITEQTGEDKQVTFDIKPSPNGNIQDIVITTTDKTLISSSDAQLVKGDKGNMKLEFVAPDKNEIPKYIVGESHDANHWQGVLVGERTDK